MFALLVSACKALRVWLYYRVKDDNDFSSTQRWLIPVIKPPNATFTRLVHSCYVDDQKLEIEVVAPSLLPLPSQKKPLSELPRLLDSPVNYSLSHVETLGPIFCKLYFEIFGNL